jgi:hypothetical protein
MSVAAQVAKNDLFGASLVGFADLNDESILCLYDNIRRQVDAERALPYKFMTGPAVRQRAMALLEELIKRRLEHTSIEWQPGARRDGADVAE